MKVEQEGTGFAPITITLETKEEADLMWAKLNTSIYDIESHSRGQITVDTKNQTMFDLNQKMWKAFDTVYQIG